MTARRDGEARMIHRPVERRLELGDGGLDDERAGHARLPHPRHHHLAIGREGRVREMAVGVDQHPQTVSGRAFGATLPPTVTPRPPSPGHRSSISKSAGVAMKSVEKVPTIDPNTITHANGRMMSPPKMSSESRTRNTVPLVKIVRGSVSLMARLISCAIEPRFASCMLSRIRSKMTIVSLSE